MQIGYHSGIFYLYTTKVLVQSYKKIRLMNLYLLPILRRLNKQNILSKQREQEGGIFKFYVIYHHPLTPSFFPYIQIISSRAEVLNDINIKLHMKYILFNKYQII